MSTRRWILGIAAAAAAGGLFFWGMKVHLRSACIEMDTPYLPLCAEASKEPEAVRERMRERLARNPGDAGAWTRLLVSETREGSSRVLPGATLAAPNNSNVARWRAAHAFENGRPEEGVALLVQVLRHRTSPQAAQVIARIAATREGAALLRPHLPHASQWLPQVLGESLRLKIPAVDMLPLVAEALGKETLPEATRQAYMRTLKGSGHWLDAYGLWLAQHKQGVPLLYNGGFDQPVAQDGFDWEFASVPRSRAGAIVQQSALARRGLVLDIDFTGRSFPATLVQQYILATPGTYRMRGEYMASKLRSEAGLAWAVVCTSGHKPVAGRSAPLQDTGGLWKPFELAFTIPPGCGAMASMQLQPAAQYEASTGMKGRISFDAFSLSPSPNSS